MNKNENESKCKIANDLIIYNKTIDYLFLEI